MSVKLQKGDVLVFKAMDSFIAKAIALLTGSDVSHAAMMYSEDKLVEVGFSGIVINNAIIKEDGREAYILRLNPEKCPEPLIKAADAYVNAKTIYNFPALVLIGGIIIYRQVRPTPEFMHLTDLIIRLACQAVNTFINKARKTGKTMTCSQLTYQIFNDCGEDYRIKLIDPCVKKRDAVQAEGVICLADMLEDISLSEIELYNDLGEIDEDPEDVARRLCDYMAKECKSGKLESGESINKVAKNAKKLLKLLEMLLKICDTALPLDALFVAPSDLLNTKNLQKIGFEPIKVYNQEVRHEAKTTTQSIL